MTLLENRNVLRFRNRSLLQKLDETTTLSGRHIQIETAKSGKPTLKMEVNGTFQYVHSKYDPEREAQRLVSHIHDLEQYNQVLFVGCGLGYVLQAFHAAYPDKKMAVYEPDLQVLDAFLDVQRLDQWPDGLLTDLISDEQKLEQYLQNCVDRGDRIYPFILPVYEKKYGRKVIELMKQIKELLLNKQENFAAEASFQKRWVMNVLRNFPFLLKTPNVLQDVDRTLFENKPVVIAAAGPSLNEEWENLRRIKAEGLAYIFAVGSAIKGLINHDIYPDAVCSYDPQAHNYRVVSIVDEKKLTTIPLIFGSTVGYETVERFGGPKLHMILTQDNVSPKLLKRTDGKSVLAMRDAPSIAVVTFELLSQLKASPIILAGQNLAYLHNQYYAQGIEYKGWKGGTMSEQEQKDALRVKDVYGHDVLTKHNLNMMRHDLEFFIKAADGSHVVNTTKGGAAIAGAEFMPMEEAIDRLLGESVVVPDWYQCTNHYDRGRAVSRLQSMARSDMELELHVTRMTKALKRLDELCVQGTSPDQIVNQISRFGKTLHKWLHNAYFNTFVFPMMKVQVEHATKVLGGVRFSRDMTQTGREIVAEFNKLIVLCLNNKKTIEPYVNELVESVSSLEE